MRRAFAVVLVAVVACIQFTPLTRAEAAGTGTFEIRAGYAKSSSDIYGTGETLGGGISAGAAYWHPVSPKVSVGGEFAFDNLGSFHYSDSFSSGEVSANALRVNPAVRLHFGSPAGTSFFTQAGCGLYNVTQKIEDDTIGSFDDTSAKVGLNIGAGVNFPVGAKSKMSFFGGYHAVSVKDEATGDNESRNYVNFGAGIGFGL